jgi:hypothetical protein
MYLYIGYNKIAYFIHGTFVFWRIILKTCKALLLSTFPFLEASGIRVQVWNIRDSNIFHISFSPNLFSSVPSALAANKICNDENVFVNNFII